MERHIRFKSIIKKVQVCEHGTTCIECCWLWKGNVDRYGYGKFRINNIHYIAHRFIYQNLYGLTLAKNVHILHTCDVRSCCNFHHLYLGNVHMNIQDAMSRNRLVRGRQQKQAKLFESQVYQIRRNYYNGGFTHNDLAQIFLVSREIIHRIIIREDWRHLLGELLIR